jgi:CRISPR-associated protein Csd2
MLNNKYDFMVIFSVKNSNPNGDPLNGNRPRIDYKGIGEVSDVCLKRKIRNRWMQTGQKVFVQSDDLKLDAFKSLKDRLDANIDKAVLKDKALMTDAVCKEWLDVRAFGQVFAYEGKDKAKGVSVGIRGPVSLQTAFSANPVNITSTQITKSVNNAGDGTGKTSDTMGMKHRVDFGLYSFAGSINPQLAMKTGFSDEDAEALKHALMTLFENDASSARPEGSMEVIKVYWWKHQNPNGQYSAAKVHRSVRIALKDGIVEPASAEDYTIEAMPLQGLELMVLEGR